MGERLYHPKEVALLAALGGVVAVLVGLPMWYTPDMGATTVTIRSRVFPPRMILPHVGHPGVPNLNCEASGFHAYNFMPAPPDDLNSETASSVTYGMVELKGWLPRGDGSSSVAYAWDDWMVTRHTSTLWPFLYHPQYETARCGLGTASRLWQTFPDGATFCKASDTLHLRPHQRKSCLGDYIGTLACFPGEMMCELPESAAVFVNGFAAAGKILIAPFDSDVRAPPGSTDCDALFDGYYEGTSSIELRFPETGQSIIKSKGTLVPESLLGSHHVDAVVLCNLTNTTVPENATSIGLLPADVSFQYDAKDHTLKLYKSTSLSLSNDWASVVIINVCLLCLAHWLADQNKNPEEPWTVVPEIGGLVAAGAGLYMQKIVTSVYDRCVDVPNGPLAAELVTWVVVVELAASTACLVLLRSQADRQGNPVPIQDAILKGKISTVRKLSHECALLGSVFLQVASSSDDMVCLFFLLLLDRFMF